MGKYVTVVTYVREGWKDGWMYGIGIGIGISPLKKQIPTKADGDGKVTTAIDASLYTCPYDIRPAAQGTKGRRSGTDNMWG